MSKLFLRSTYSNYIRKVESQYFSKNEFTQNVAALVFGSVVAQAIPFLMIPVLTRIYSPEEFGHVAVFLAIVSIFSILATGRYEIAIVLPEKNKTASNLVKISLFLALTTGTLFFILLLFFKDAFLNLINAPELRDLILLVPVAGILLATFQIINYWLYRQKKFNASSVNKISQTATTEFTNVVLGLVKVFNGLIIGRFFGLIAGNIVAWRSAFKSDFSLRKNNTGEIIKDAKKYRDFPLFSLGPAVLDTFSLQLPIFLLVTFFTMADSGYFNLSRQILGIPLLILSDALSKVLYQKLSDNVNRSLPVFHIVKKILLLLTAFGALYVTVVYFTAPFIFEWVLGKEWRIVGEFSAILSFSFAIKFIVVPLSVVFFSLKKIKIGSLWHIFYFCSILLLYFFDKLNIFQFLTVLVIIEIITYLVYLFLIIRLSKGFDNSLSDQSQKP